MILTVRSSGVGSGPGGEEGVLPGHHSSQVGPA